MSANLVSLGGRDFFSLLKIIFPSRKNELLDINKTYINIGNGQKYEFSKRRFVKPVPPFKNYIKPIKKLVKSV